MSWFLRDYANSFLLLLKQLSRNEYYVRQGQTNLGTQDDFAGSSRMTKVAVSPLSFGPSSDQGLATSIILSLLNVKLHAAKEGEGYEKAAQVFNKEFKELKSALLEVCPVENGARDFFVFMLDVFWLDLGQLAYVLHRSKSVESAFKPLRNVTFSTRDFWTEVALLDRLGHTSKHWVKPMS